MPGKHYVTQVNERIDRALVALGGKPKDPAAPHTPEEPCSRCGGFSNGKDADGKAICYGCADRPKEPHP